MTTTTTTTTEVVVRYPCGAWRPAWRPAVKYGREIRYDPYNKYRTPKIEYNPVIGYVFSDEYICLRGKHYIVGSYYIENELIHRFVFTPYDIIMSGHPSGWIYQKLVFIYNEGYGNINKSYRYKSPRNEYKRKFIKELKELRRILRNKESVGGQYCPH